MQVCQPVQSVTLTYCSREEQKQNMTTRNHLQQCKKWQSQIYYLPHPLFSAWKKAWLHISLSNYKTLWDKHQHLTPNQVCSPYIQYQENAYKIWCQPRNFFSNPLWIKLTFSNPEITHLNLDQPPCPSPLTEH